MRNSVSSTGRQSLRKTRLAESILDWTLVTSRRKNKIEAGSLGERFEVAVSGEKSNATVDTALRNQRIAKACSAAFCQHHRAENSCTLPIDRKSVV